MIWILLIILLVILVFAIVAVTAIYQSSNKQYHRSDIHFSGGANTDTGQMTSDNNYFKGISGELEDTIPISNSARSGRPSGKLSQNITIRNLNDSSVANLKINDYLIIGRNDGEKVFKVSNDNTVSKKHCKLYYEVNNLYLCDLNSSNYTYLNKKRLTKPEICKSGDIIKVGKTYLKIEF
ncbi:FHA domain-containing protein [Ruminococcus sp.]|uniref:FHA domain-containing protein n=1 Tax=Ruminococcus sp. TaxID=41978 RepID=UPI0025CCC159|nr:FHA domain-containing protein [Ruminococcus sp.]MCI6616521.1 FHA domain-containing protein [Ruminococcus sp.]